MSNANDNVGKLSKVVNIAEARFGAVHGAANNTAALQAAINAACAINGTLEMIPGDWYVSHLNFPDNFEWSCPEPAGCRIIQIAGSNRNLITVPYTIVQNPIIRNITIDGNRSGNSSGHGIYLEPDLVSAYGFAITMENSYIQNCAEKCLYVGKNRNYGRLLNTELKRGGTGCMYMTEASDWQCTKPAFAFPITGCALEVISGAANVFEGGAAYGAITDPAVRITNTGSSPTLIHGMIINFNQREAVHIIGASGLGRPLGNQLIGCFFAENGLETDNTYSHIKLEDTSGAIIALNTFRWLGSGNRAKYLVETTGASGESQFVCNSWDDTLNVTYGTAVTNAVANLIASVGNLNALGYVESSGIFATSGTANLDVRAGDARVRALRAMYVASGVNWVDIYPAVAGDAVQIAAESTTDTNVDLRLVPKGTGAVRFGTRTASGDAPVTGYIEIKDSGGTLRRLAVIG